MQLISSGAKQFQGYSPGPQKPQESNHLLLPGAAFSFIDVVPTYLSAQACWRNRGQRVQTPDTLLQSFCVAPSMRNMLWRVVFISCRSDSDVDQMVLCEFPPGEVLVRSWECQPLHPEILKGSFPREEAPHFVKIFSNYREQLLKNVTLILKQFWFKHLFF